MQGTGTQADPYQITNVDELIEYAKKDDIYLKLMNDIDFNNYTGWMLPSIEVRCFEIDGDGHSLNNIYIKNKSLFYITDDNGPYTVRTSTFKNITMEIIQIGNGQIFKGYERSSAHHKYIQILDCDIRIKSYPTNSITILHNTGDWSERVGIRILRSIINVDVYGCGHSITLINSEEFDFNWCSIEYSEIQLNVYNGNNTNVAVIGRMNIDNVAIFVNIDKIDTNYSRYTYKILFNYTQLTNSYIIAKQDNLERMYWNYDNSRLPTFLSACFFNKDYAQIGAMPNLYGLTTDECKSVSKLTEIGFIVA